MRRANRDTTTERSRTRAGASDAVDLEVRGERKGCEETDMNDRPIEDDRSVDTKDLDSLTADLREIEGVYHATSNSAGAADWLSVTLDANWEARDTAEGYDVPDRVLAKCAANRWGMVGINAQWNSTEDRYNPVCTFRPVEWIVGLVDAGDASETAGDGDTASR